MADPSTNDTNKTKMLAGMKEKLFTEHEPSNSSKTAPNLRKFFRVEVDTSSKTVPNLRKFFRLEDTSNRDKSRRDGL